MLSITIREEEPQDEEGIRQVNLLAFGQPEEAGIVDSLRLNSNDLVSLVAVAGSDVVGHILFSPVELITGTTIIRGMGLAPMAVLPDHQRQGIGSQLVRSGLLRLNPKHWPFVIVLGHPGYYPRFGFEPASRHGLRCQWEVPDDAFMVRVLDAKKMKGVRGLACYRPEFDAAM